MNIATMHAACKTDHWFDPSCSYIRVRDAFEYKPEILCGPDKKTEFELGIPLLQRFMAQINSPFCSNLQMMDYKASKLFMLPGSPRDFIYGFREGKLRGFLTFTSPAEQVLNSLTPMLSAIPRIHKICPQLYTITFENFPELLIFMFSHDYKILWTSSVF